MGSSLPDDWKLRRQAAGRQHLTTEEVRELFADADGGATGFDAGRGGLCDAQAQASW
jgi:hypothetical protein